MDKLIELLTLFVVALSVLLFFGPIVVILSIVEEIKIWGKRVIRLPNVGRNPIVRVTLAVVGIGIWLAVYIPLVSLAKQAVSTPDSAELPSPDIVQQSEQPTKTPITNAFLPTNTPTLFPVDTATFTPMPILTSTPISLSVEMVLVPAGTYRMGTSYWQGDDYDFAPGHNVYVSEFYIDKYEVTNAQYAECVSAGVCSPPVVSRSNTREHYYDNLDVYANYPVIFVSWEDAFVFCTWRGARLPTEAEWEKAAKWDFANQTAVLFPWGDEPPNPELVNYRGQDTEEVGVLAGGKSPAGAFDMAGNVYEWVYDFYDPNYYDNSPERDPLGPSSSPFGHVARGGAWSIEEPSGLWTFVRYYFPATERRNDLGFRCAKDAR